MANTCKKCGKSYIHRQSLSKHKRTCNKKPNSGVLEKINTMLNINTKKAPEDEERMEVSDGENGESSASSSNMISLKEIRSRALLGKLSHFVHLFLHTMRHLK